MFELPHIFFVIFSDFKIAPADLSQPFCPPCHITGETEHSYSFLQAIRASPCSTVNPGGDYMQGQHREKDTDKLLDMLCLSFLELYLMMNSLQ